MTVTEWKHGLGGYYRSDADGGYVVVNVIEDDIGWMAIYDASRGKGFQKWAYVGHYETLEEAQSAADKAAGIEHDQRPPHADKKDHP